MEIIHEDIKERDFRKRNKKHVGISNKILSKKTGKNRKRMREYWEEVNEEERGRKQLK